MPTGPTFDLASLNAGTALFSDCGSYRYLLTREFSASGETCLFIMLNPSTADANLDDPTIGRCAGFARRWGMAELRVVNLFALRSSDPKQLEWAEDPVGPDNDAVIASELRRASLIVVAWGNHGKLHGRADEVRSLVAQSGVTVQQLGTNITGEPRHPLYVAFDAGLSLHPLA